MTEFQRPKMNSRQLRASLSAMEVEKLAERPLYCPECGFKIGSAYSDCTGHMRVKCQKCKTVSILNFAYFRRSHRNRRHPIGKLIPVWED